MKLRNKKTGEIAERVDISIRKVGVVFNNDETYDTLAKLNEEWEDYEESKEYWFIDYDGGIIPFPKMKDTATDRMMKQIGNYFNTREEAEKTVEKLKAVKRLKDKGFKFDLLPALGHCDDKKFDISIIGTMPAKWWYNDKVVDDIYYIFGGEE